MISITKLKGYPKAYHKFGFDYYKWNVNVYTGKHMISIKRKHVDSNGG